MEPGVDLPHLGRFLYLQLPEQRLAGRRYGDRLASVDARPITSAISGGAIWPRQTLSAECGNVHRRQAAADATAAGDPATDDHGNGGNRRSRKSGYHRQRRDVWTQIMATPGLGKRPFVGTERYPNCSGSWIPDDAGRLREERPPDAGVRQVPCGPHGVDVDFRRQLEHIYKLRNDKATLDVVAIWRTLPASRDPDDADIVAKYREQEPIRGSRAAQAQFVRISTSDIVAGLKVTREDVERYYSDHLGDYTTPEQLRAVNPAEDRGEERGESGPRPKAC
jgi:hypothetical protein